MDTPYNPYQTSRGARGKYVRSLTAAKNDAHAAELRTAGWTYRRIAAELDMSVSSAHGAVQRVLKETVREAGDDLRALELERLDAELERLTDLEDAARTVLDRKHVTVSHGRIIHTADPDTGEEQPLIDDGPVLQAIDRLIRIDEARRKNGESRRKLLGMDEPTKTSVSGAVTYTVTGVDLEQLR